MGEDEGRMEGGGREPTGRRGSSGKTGRCEPESRLRCNAILLFIRQAGEGEEGGGDLTRVPFI